MPFYSNMPWDFRTAVICLTASFGDVLMILIIYSSVSFLLKDFFWVKHFKFNGIFFSIIIGFIISIIVEKIALSVNMWSYSNNMFLIPFLKVGITPTLQMIILPLIIFKFSNNKLLNFKRSRS